MLRRCIFGIFAICADSAPIVRTLMKNLWEIVKSLLSRWPGMFALLGLLAASGVLVPFVEIGLDLAMSCDSPFYGIEADRENSAGIERGIRPTYRIYLKNNCSKSFTDLVLKISVNPTSETPLEISKGIITSNEIGKTDYEIVSPGLQTLTNTELAANTSVRAEFFPNQPITAICLISATGPNGTFISRKNQCVVYSACSWIPNICNWWYTSQP